MEMESRILTIRAEIDAVNRNAELVAATKMRTPTEIARAMATGCIAAAGENKVQEFREKYTDDYPFDFIGQLQTNKVKYLVGRVRLIHSLDRLSLAETIARECEKKGLVQDVLLEINAGAEPSKGGILLKETERFYDEVSMYPQLRVRGLMAVAPAYYSEKELEFTYGEVFKKYQAMKSDGFCYLSMGMSGDYKIALRNGANLVRLGTAIFGGRNYGDVIH